MNQEHSCPACHGTGQVCVCGDEDGNMMSRCPECCKPVVHGANPEAPSHDEGAE